jgi:hypothetical protein
VEADENIKLTSANFAKRVLGASQLNLDKEFPLVEPANDQSTDSDNEKSPPTPAQAVPDAEDYSSVKGTSASQATEWPEVRVEEGVEKLVSGRGVRTASEMADIILNVLRSVDGVPERGFEVTVYGGNPWNAMLTIKPEAGRIKAAQLWRKRVHEIGVRLRRDFEIIHETEPREGRAPSKILTADQGF